MFVSTRLRISQYYLKVHNIIFCNWTGENYINDLKSVLMQKNNQLDLIRI